MNDRRAPPDYNGTRPWTELNPAYQEDWRRRSFPGVLQARGVLENLQAMYSTDDPEGHHRWLRAELQGMLNNMPGGVCWPPPYARIETFLDPNICVHCVYPRHIHRDTDLACPVPPSKANNWTWTGAWSTVQFSPQGIVPASVNEASRFTLKPSES